MKDWKKDFDAGHEQGVRDERKRIVAKLESLHKELRNEIPIVGVDTYSMDYKQGILRGYTLFGRYLYGQEDL